MRFLRVWFLFAVGALYLSSQVGCNKSAPKNATPTFTINGAAEVLAALNRNDYDTAVRGLAEIKTRLTADQNLEFVQLFQKVKETMATAMTTNESAAKAYQSLRFIQAGR